MRIRLWTTLLATLAVAAVGTAGCTSTRSESSCSGQTCRVQLDGPGAQITVDSVKTVVRLDRVGNDKASLSINAQPIVIAENQTGTVAQTRIKIIKIEDERVTLTLQPAS